MHLTRTALNKRPTEPLTLSKFPSHIKVYSNNSAPQVLSSFACYKAKQDLTLLEFQLNQSETSSALQVKEEEILSLTLRIEQLESQLKEFSSTPNCKKCLFFEKDNKKLKEKLFSAESSVDRLYKESKVLTDQLSLLQARLENLPESSDSFVYLKDQIKDLVFEVELDLTQDLQEMDKKVRQAENWVERLAEKQSLLNKSLKILPKVLPSAEKKSFQTLPEPESQQLEEYQQEIFRLGSMIVRFQEKYEALLAGNKEKLNQVRIENFRLKEELNLFLLKSDEKNNITKIPVHLTGHGSSPNKLPGKKKLMEENKQQVEFLNELHNEQLEKLHKELENLRHSYSQQEVLLLKSQSSLKNHQDSLNSSLLTQVSEQKSLISAQGNQISSLSEENNRLKTEVKELSQSELSKKYSKLIIEFQTFQKIHEEIQNLLQKTEEKNQYQEEIINSLKLGFYPHNSSKELLADDKSHEISLLKDQLEKKNLIIEDMRNQILVSSQEHEEDKHRLMNVNEMYKAAREQVSRLEKNIENLEVELESCRLRIDN